MICIAACTIGCWFHGVSMLVYVRAISKNERRIEVVESVSLSVVNYSNVPVSGYCIEHYLYSCFS